MECISLKSINIPSKTRLLSGNCFSDCKHMENVSFAQGSILEKLGSGCFSGCKNLKYVLFGVGSSLETIEANAFSDCISLEFFDFPRKTKLICASAFINCKSMINISFDVNGLLEKIDINAFKKCELLSDINFPSKLESIGTDAFAECTNLNKIVYCGFNIFNGNSFPKLKNARAYVKQNYPSDASDFGGLPVIRILDGSCFFPTYKFTEVLGFGGNQVSVATAIVLSDEFTGLEGDKL